MTTTGDAFGTRSETRSTYGAVTRNGDEIGAEIAPKITPETRPHTTPKAGVAAADAAGHSAASTTARGLGTRSATRSAHESEAEAEEVPTSSGLNHRGAGAISDAEITTRIRTTPQADALARLVTDLRPDWNPVLVYRWALTDDRAWSVVVAAGIAGARDPGIKHPNGIASVGPQLETSPTPPPPMHEHRAYLRAIRDNDCGHGDTADRCALCRHHLPPLEVTE